jgi:hypothetical protein
VVHVPAGAAAITVREGTIVVLDVTGDPGYGWSTPTNSDAAVLTQLSASTNAHGDLNAAYRASAPGEAVLVTTREKGGALAGYRLRVTVH